MKTPEKIFWWMLIIPAVFVTIVLGIEVFTNSSTEKFEVTSKIKAS
jgi:Na+/H+-dicarboxylate symporter